jgi:hypothetical protein
LPGQRRAPYRLALPASGALHRSFQEILHTLRYGVRASQDWR